MKKLLMTIVMGFVVLAAQAQITFTQANTGLRKPGPVHTYVTTQVTGLSAPKEGTNQVWNYSMMSGGAVVTGTQAVEPSFSSTAVAGSQHYEQILNLPGGKYGVFVNTVYDKDTTDLFQAGYVIDSQSYRFSITSNSKDTIIFPAQTEKARENLIAFPGTMSSTWSSAYVHTINFILSSNITGYIDAPCKKISYVTAADSLAGWGSVTIPSSNKASLPYQVLLIKRHITTRDSFFTYVADPAARKHFTQAYFLTQGAFSNGYIEEFYRAGYSTPLLTIFFDNDSTWTKPTAAQYTADDVTSGIDDNEGLNESGFTVYPNPSHDNMVTCRFYKPSARAWTVNVTNALGQSIYTRAINETGDLRMNVDNSAWNNGLYLLQITDENGDAKAAVKLVVAK